MRCQGLLIVCRLMGTSLRWAWGRLKIVGSWKPSRLCRNCWWINKKIKMLMMMISIIYIWIQISFQLLKEERKGILLPSLDPILKRPKACRSKLVRKHWKAYVAKVLKRRKALRNHQLKRILLISLKAYLNYNLQKQNKK